MNFIFRPGDEPREAQLGGKAGALAALQSSGLSIPRWFVVLPQAFDASLPERDRRVFSAGATPTDPQAILARIELAPSVLRELNHALAELSPAGEFFAVRSSALDEDDRDHSFAGQLESFLWVRPEAVPGRIVAVWKSAFSPRVRAYRERHGLAAAPRAPAVLIQRMVNAEVAGVAFGADPITGRPDLAVVSAVRGLGTGLVNGESNADEWSVDSSGGIVQRRLASNRYAKRSDHEECRRSADPEGNRRHTAIESKIRRDEATPPSPPTEGGAGRGEEGCWPISETPLPIPLPVRASRGEGEDRCHPAAVLNSIAVERQRPVLEAAQVRDVAELVRRTGAILGCSQDIEWAMENGELYLLQSRPVTAIANRGEPNIWDNSNISESYHGVTLPLTFSFARRAYTGVYRQFCQLLAVPAARIAAHDHTFRHMIGLIRGRVYYNLLNWYRVLALLPGFTLNRRFMEQMMGVKEELPQEILAELKGPNAPGRVKDGCDLAFSLAALVSNHFLLPRKILRFQQRLNEALSPPNRPLETMSPAELSGYFLGLEQKLLTRWDAPLLNDFFAMIFHGVLRRLALEWGHDPAGTLPNELLCRGGGMISAEPARLIRALAELASAHARLVDQLCDGPLPSIFSAMEQVPKFKSAYLDYLARFGDRCLEELKLESLTLRDDPTLLLRTVGQLARLRYAKATADRSIGADDARRSAEARINRALARRPFKRALFFWALRHSRARVRDRENLRFERTRLFGRVRSVFIELGRRLHAAGHLHDPRHVFFLEIDEVLGFIAGTATTANLKELVALREAEFSRYQSEPPPPNRFTTHGIVNHGTPWQGVQSAAPEFEGQQRSGIGCSPGVVRGCVRKIADPRNASLHAGEILVAERTDPGWILLFPAAAGLLVERGSLLSHSAIVARELRLPAIVSIDGLMAWLSDGDEVEFDGSTGIVRRIEPAPTLAAHPLRIERTAIAS